MKGKKMGEQKITVVIVDDEPIVRMDLREMLEFHGYDVVGEAKDGFDAVAVCKEIHPELVFMDIKMPLLDGISAARILFEEKLAETVILLTAYSTKEYVENAVESGISGYLVKPVDGNALVPAIEMARAKSAEIRRLQKELDKMTRRLDDRILLEQAKGWLMESRKCTEDDAYRLLRKISQEKNLSMRRVAEYILYSKKRKNER